MDSTLVARGKVRAPFHRFLLWLLPWAALLGVGLYAAYLCLAVGLNQTNMDNRFAFGLWIYLDLTVIALGAGAFFTGFLLYVMKRKELAAVINSAVVIGFICYSGAIGILAIDVGQPLRAWFTFWHPNVHSMLTEVTFCLTCYLTVLAIEYLPLVLRNRRLRRSPSVLVFEFELHKVMAVFALVGTFLSFFHQGSLGGLYGVLSGRPFAFRESLAAWPTTFFLFILSAAAVGPSFVIVTTWLVSRICGRVLVRPDVYQLLAKVSGSLLVVYVLAKAVDTLVWLNHTSPHLGARPDRFYAFGPFGTWVLFTEIVALGLVPALLLAIPRTRRDPRVLVGAAFLACAGIVTNRFVMTVQTLALPTLAFDPFLSYTPSWQETASFGAVVAYGVILYSLSFRYLNLFPQERDLAAQEAR
ncbi:MAG: NrfD/PsrC family molybdoenzyme membrane anchor subunit [Vicinamibacteria bacterium]